MIYFTENSIVIDEDESTSVGTEIEFPNSVGSLLLSIHGSPDTLEESMLQSLAEEAIKIAQNYNQFKSWVVDYICSNLEENLEVSPDEIYEDLDLIQMSSNEDLSIFCYTFSLESLLEDDQLLNVYYDSEEQDLVNIEVVNDEDGEEYDDFGDE